MSNRVFVLNPDRSPLMPCTAKRARKLLEAGRAAVWRRYPFTILLKEEAGTVSQPLALKLDPGSKTTGVALVMEGKTGRQCVWGAELQHRGLAIKMKLQARRSLRSSRRSRKLRHRPARFLNRTRPAGRLAPSLMHRVLTVGTWVTRLVKWTPISHLSMELVRFDTQRLEAPEISGAEYQRGTLWGYEVRGYLLQKFGYRCAYCGEKDVPLEVDHVHARSRGGSDRVSNLAIACVPCNRKKGSQPVEHFLAKKPELLRKILSQAKAPLRDAAAVNSSRWKLYETLQGYGFPVEVGTGGRTRYNRTQQGYDKAHWVDAACVGESGEQVAICPLKPLTITCMGRGNRQMCGTDKYGFPVRHRTRAKVFFGFQTGDIVRADVPGGKYAGVHTGRIAVRARPSFKLGNFDVHPNSLTAKQRADGYAYSV